MKVKLFLAALAMLLTFQVLKASESSALFRIMPLGDSITRGIVGSSTQSGYRLELYSLLTGAGYEVDFVGSLADGISGFDRDHEGHGGYRDDQIALMVYNWLTSNPADIVLLHIGTNAVNENPGDVEDILSEIDRFEKDNSVTIWVVLARIINRNCITDIPPCTESLTTTKFNNNVIAMAQDRIDLLGDKIIIVDMEDGAGIDYYLSSDNPPGDMWDDLHPFDTGYEKMAIIWFSAIGTVLPAPSTAEDLQYTPVTPCRIVDTRLAGGAIPPGGVRSYDVRGALASQGGNPSGCPSPKGEPRAVHVNVTVLPLGNGNVRAFPFGSASPTASLVNYRSDAQNVANSGTVKTCFNCAKDINIQSNFGTAHVVIDVLGYYYSNPWH
jgi:lysophospholipase L1-like esterase